MAPEILTTVILGVLGILTGTGYWGYRQSRREAPVKQRDADIAAAERSQQMALAVADDLRQDLSRLRGELGTERDERKGLSAEVQALSAQVRHQSRLLETVRDAFGKLSRWADHIVENWDTVRKSEAAPERPKLDID